MEKAVHNFVLRLSLAIVISLLTPWPLSSNVSSSDLDISKAGDLHQPAGLHGQGVGGFDESECIRGKPEPVLKKSTFKRISLATAEEKYRMDQNVDLTIQHGGCSYFSEIYRFSIKAGPEGKNDWRKWMDVAADLLSALPIKDIVAMQIRDMVASLRSQAKSAVAYSFRTEIPMAEGESLSFDVQPAEGGTTDLIVVYQIVM